MQFNGKELTAILKMANAMVFADGHIDQEEIKAVSGELIRFGVTEEQLPVLLKASEIMEETEAIAILAGLDDEKKKYVASFLGAIMAIDGDIDDKEVILWRFVSTLCGFPTIDISEAVSYMAKLYS